MKVIKFWSEIHKRAKAERERKGQGAGRVKAVERVWSKGREEEGYG